jgi:hypothetical protein
MPMPLVRCVLALAVAAGLFGFPPAGAEASLTGAVYNYDAPAGVTTPPANTRAGAFRVYASPRNVRAHPRSQSPVETAPTASNAMVGRQQRECGFVRQRLEDPEVSLVEDGDAGGRKVGAEGD